MSIPNLDGDCYLQAAEAQRTHQQDWLKDGYAPAGFYLKDFCLIEIGERFHLYHIAGTPGVSCCLPGNELWFGHASTHDFLTWETHLPCFYIDPDGWDGGHVFAPYVVEKDNAYWMFYTGVAIDNTQRIGLARSSDGFTWQRVSKEPIIHPEKTDWAFCPTSGGAACRDAHVIRHGADYYLYYTAVTRSGKACVARARSQNLLDWQDCGPAYIADDLRHCESSNVQLLDDRYLLSFGGHIESWSVVFSDSPESWPAQKPLAIGQGITAMEVLRRRDPRWLVAFFYIDRLPLSSGHRLFLGQIDWAAQSPRIEVIDNPESLSSWFSGPER